MVRTFVRTYVGKPCVYLQPNHETNIEENVKSVADFSRGESGKGMYSLKPDCRSQFNPFFYHYTKSEMSKAEDYQRTLRRQNNLDQGTDQLYQ